MSNKRKSPSTDNDQVDINKQERKEKKQKAPPLLFDVVTEEGILAGVFPYLSFHDSFLWARTSHRLYYLSGLIYPTLGDKKTEQWLEDGSANQEERIQFRMDAFRGKTYRVHPIVFIGYDIYSKEERTDTDRQHNFDGGIIFRPKRIRPGGTSEDEMYISKHLHRYPATNVIFGETQSSIIYTTRQNLNDCGHVSELTMTNFSKRRAMSLIPRNITTLTMEIVNIGHHNDGPHYNPTTFTVYIPTREDAPNCELVNIYFSDSAQRNVTFVDGPSPPEVNLYDLTNSIQSIGDTKINNTSQYHHHQSMSPRPFLAKRRSENMTPEIRCAKEIFHCIPCGHHAWNTVIDEWELPAHWKFKHDCKKNIAINDTFMLEDCCSVYCRVLKSLRVIALDELRYQLHLTHQSYAVDDRLLRPAREASFIVQCKDYAGPRHIAEGRGRRSILIQTPAKTRSLLFDYFCGQGNDASSDRSVLRMINMSPSCCSYKKPRTRKIFNQQTF